MENKWFISTDSVTKVHQYFVSIIYFIRSDTPRMSSSPQGSSKNSEFNTCKIEFNPNVSHFIWFSSVSQTKKSEKTPMDIKDLNDLDEEIEENFNLEKFEDMKIPNKQHSTSKSIVQSIEPPSKNGKNKCLIKIKSTFKSKLVHFMKESRFAGIPLAMSK